ncbi:hypothetical protein Zmor_011957 [Zophobas morio]|uniref:DUS-like FMN-binding domain-containing protein n=1 Tax=Zophobas morio TaxID=2755281 RepID=A0AA38LYT3_9CUCU|nr:hypothetical protein Zmor_011957 [Zophobas morio]
MGSSLLTKPDLVKEILTSLVRNVTLPITCKIRLLPTIAETVTLAQLIEGTGVAAVAVHGRFVTERPREPVHYDYIKAVADSVRIPVIANGASLDIAVYDDIAAVKQKTGCASVMLARAAQWNPSIFSFGKTTANPLDNAREYIKLALQYGQDLGNIKFNLQHLLHFAPDKILKGKLSSAANSQELWCGVVYVCLFSFHLIFIIVNFLAFLCIIKRTLDAGFNHCILLWTAIYLSFGSLAPSSCSMELL